MPAPLYDRLVHTAFDPPPSMIPAVLAAVDQRRRWPAGMPPQRLSLSAWVIDYVRSPGLSMQIGGRRSAWQVRSARTLHIYAPHTVFSEDYRACSKRPFASSWLLVRDHAAGVLATLTGARGWVHIADPEGNAQEVFERLFSSPAVTQWQAQAALMELLGQMYGSAIVGAGERLIQTPSQSYPGLIEEVDAWFRPRLSQRIRLAGLARAVHLPSSTLSHRYRSLAGQSPMARLRDLRMQLATSLLLQGQPLTAVAATTGFGDRFHLSKAFKTHTGRSPQEFLRQATGAKQKKSPED